PGELRGRHSFPTRRSSDLGREYGEGGIRMPRRSWAARSGPTVQVERMPVDTRTTEQQLADLDREIEEWRLRAEIEKRKRERPSTDRKSTRLNSSHVKISYA